MGDNDPGARTPLSIIIRIYLNYYLSAYDFDFIRIMFHHFLNAGKKYNSFSLLYTSKYVFLLEAKINK